MQPVKEIATVLESRNYSIENSICETMKKFKFKTLCHQAGIQKGDGYSATEIITLLLMLPLMALKNVHQLYKSEYGKKVEMKRDALYRLKNNSRYPWRKLLYSVAKAFRGLVDGATNGDSAEETKTTKPVSALIIDDTIDQRTGYKMENISYVHDHVAKKTIYGYKVLVAALFDGKSIIPLDFSVHSEKKLERRKAKKQYKKETDAKSSGGKRRKELKNDKISQALDMVKRAVKNGIVTDYVLCDSWFTSNAFIKAIRGIKGGAMHVIAGVRNDRRKYGYDGGAFNAKEIVSMLKARGSEKRCRHYNIRYREAIVEYDGIGTVKLFMCRYPRQKEWRVFITTDAALTFMAMMKTYCIRWTIEVMFRETKQHLHFGKCQSQDFDAQIASITVTFMLYILLAYLKRRGSYETLGELFRLTQQDVCEKNLAERLWMIFEDLLTLAIESIAANGTIDITSFKETEEFKCVREIYASSFLFNQLKSVDNAA